MQVTLGKTGITVNKNGFGALPIQRIGKEEAAAIVTRAFENGITFFDTARFYTDSEEKLGYALHAVRDRIILATKTGAKNAEEFWAHLDESLRFLQTGYVDIYQFHNPDFCPKPGDGSGLYEAMLSAKEKGLIRHIGITNHRLSLAADAVASGLYETVQFPFSYLSTERETELVSLCREKNVGFLAMKALSGGLITDSAAAYAYMARFDNVLPLWGIQRESELDAFLAYDKNPPQWDEKTALAVERDRKALTGAFCRGCGYCQPCPAGIEIQNAARMSLLLRRAPTSVYLNEEWQAKMRKIEDCTGCGHCKDNCPYGLDTPRLLQENWADYRKFM